MAAHFEKRNTKFGGGKIGIGKRGQAGRANEVGAPPTNSGYQFFQVISKIFWCIHCIQ